MPEASASPPVDGALAQGPNEGDTNPAPPARPPGLFFQQCWCGAFTPTLLEVQHLTWSRRANSEPCILIDKVNNFVQVNRPRQLQMVPLVVARRQKNHAIAEVRQQLEDGVHRNRHPPSTPPTVPTCSLSLP